MSVTETRRIALLEAAQQNLGRDVAITLMEMLPPSGWGDVATRQRVDALEHDMRLRLDALEAKHDVRFDAVDHRLDALEAKHDVRFDAVDHRLDALEARYDARFDSFASEIRSEMRAGFAELRADVAEMRVSTTRWAVGTVLSTAAIGAAVAGVLVRFA